MKQINLVPFGDQKRQAISAMVVAGVVGLVVGAALGGGLYLAVRQEVSAFQDRVVASVAGSASQSPSDAAAANRILQANLLGKDEVQWSKALSFVSSILPQDIHLASYSYGAAVGTPGMALKVSGIADSNAGFAAFVKTLGTTPGITSSKVDSYLFVPATGTVSFTISAVVPVAQIGYPADGGTQ